MDASLIDDLRRMPLFADWTSEHLKCIESGIVIAALAGEQLVQEGSPADYFYILLSGEMRIVKVVGEADMILATYQSGAFFGEVPILLDTPYVASGYVTQTSRLFRLDKEAFWLMLARCPAVNRVILQTMAKRVQGIQIIAQQHDKLTALSTLSAGLAHELNNPASAGQSAVLQLRTTWREWQEQAACLSDASNGSSNKSSTGNSAEASPDSFLFEEQRTRIAELADIALQNLEKVMPLSIMEQSEREEQIIVWLEAHSIGENWSLATKIVEIGIDLVWLDCLAQAVPPAVLEVALRYVTAMLSSHRLLNQIESSSRRISSLVDSIKTYSYMDQGAVQAVDIHAGMDSTLTMLTHELEGISMIRNYTPDLPRITAFGSELNQVWTELIDNAADSLGGIGAITADDLSQEALVQREKQITINTMREGDWALIEVCDNGMGIPTEIQARVFEPFFTTKAVGAGKGLGLDFVYRTVVGRHGGNIRFDSQPGHTCFQVRLPLQKRAQTEI